MPSKMWHQATLSSSYLCVCSHFIHSEAAASQRVQLVCRLFRGHKRKYGESEEEEGDGEKKEAEEESSDESSKDSNEEEGGSSSEADEMAAALEAELNDFIWYKQNNKDVENNGQEHN